MDLFNYVALLLQTQQSVGVEGLGTFSNEYIAGTFDEEQDSFLPPRVQVAYRQGVENPEVLEQFIADKKGLEVLAAKQWIQDKVQRVVCDVASGGICNAYPLGTLSKKDDTLVFESLTGDHSINHTFFGLPTLEAEDSQFQFSEVESSISVEAVDEKEVQPANPLISLAEETDHHISENLYEEHFKEERGVLEHVIQEEERPMIASGMWKWILWLVVLVFLSLALYMYTQRPKWAEKWLPAQVKTIDSNRLLLTDDVATDSTIYEVNKAWADSNLVDTVGNDSSALKLKERANRYLEAPPSIVDTFQVIIASFPNRATASKQLALYKQRGYDAQIAYGAKGVRTKIAIGTFTNIDSAVIQQKLMQKKGFKEAWILIKKAN